MYHVDADAELTPLACAYARARGADRMSSFGDWIALSDVCDLATAKLIKHEVSDGIIAPGYDADALEVLKSKKKGNYNIVAIDPDYEPAKLETRTVFGVTFEQGRQDLDISDATMLQNIVTENKEISAEQRRDLIISLIVLKYTQSQQRLLRAGRPDHRRGCRPAEPHPLHPPGGPEGRQLAAAPHAQGAEPALPGGYLQAQPGQTPSMSTSATRRRMSSAMMSGPRPSPSSPRPSPRKKSAPGWTRSPAFPWAATPSSPLATTSSAPRRSGVTAIVQPGGSIRDQQVIDTCKPLRYCHGLLRHPAVPSLKNRTCLRRFFVAGSCAVKGVQYEDSRCWRRRA